MQTRAAVPPPVHSSLYIQNHIWDRAVGWLWCRVLLHSDSGSVDCGRAASLYQHPFLGNKHREGVAPVIGTLRRGLPSDDIWGSEVDFQEVCIGLSLRF